MGIMVRYRKVPIPEFGIESRYRKVSIPEKGIDTQHYHKLSEAPHRIDLLQHLLSYSVVHILVSRYI